MSYSVTGIRAAPDIGFRAEHRHTAQGAIDLVTSFVAEGLREIEVRDDRGDLRSFSDLRRASGTHGDEDHDAARRLAALF